MKITIRSKENIEEKISIDDIEPGIVFQYGNGVTALKLENEYVALLKYSYGNDWFEIDNGSMNHHGVKILGRLDEIIVVEEI